MCNISNTKLSHSESAISVIHEFYDKKFMLYVEGDDDIPFGMNNLENMFLRIFIK